MKNIRGKKQFKILIFVLIGIITLGIGYAGITAINLVVNGTGSATASQDNFKVKFKTASITTGEGSANITSDTTATFSVSGLTKETDQAVATYTIKNESNGVGAEISLGLENTNSEYFKVTEYVEDTELQAGDTTTATITVEMIKTPIDENPTTTITGTLTANPKDNASATGSDSATATPTAPNYFAIDSWNTIQTNVRNGNANRYNIGDTKTVTIDGNDYTVRVANKSTASNCGNEDYSETACGFVVEFADIVAESDSSDSYASEYNGAYNYIKNTLYNQLPNDLQKVITTTKVMYYDNYNCDSEDCAHSTNDKLYLLSGVEVFGNDSREEGLLKTTTTQLDYYKNMSCVADNDYLSFGVLCSKAIKKINNGDFAWHLRTADWDWNNQGGLDIVTELGGEMGSTSKNGIAPAFRIV